MFLKLIIRRLTFTFLGRRSARPSGGKTGSLIITINAFVIMRKKSISRLANAVQVKNMHASSATMAEISVILRHKHVVTTRVKMLFTVFQYLFAFQRYSSF